MRTIENYTLRQETLESQRAAGRYSGATEIVFKDKTGTHTHVLGVGTRDVVSVFREGEDTLVLSTNFGMDYVGVVVFKGSEIVGEFFTDNPKENIGDLRKEWHLYDEINLVKILSQYVSP